MPVPLPAFFPFSLQEEETEKILRVARVQHFVEQLRNSDGRSLNRVAGYPLAVLKMALDIAHWNNLVALGAGLLLEALDNLHLREAIVVGVVDS